MSLYIFIVIVLAINLWMQKGVSTWLGAFKRSLVVSLTVVTAFHVFVYWYAGYIDPFIDIVVVIQLTISIVIGYLVGLAYMKFK